MTTGLLVVALYTSAPFVALAIIAWPRRAHQHRISNYFFLRRVRREQSRSRPGGGSTISGQPILLPGSGVAARRTTRPPHPADTTVTPRPRVRRAQAPVGARSQHQGVSTGRVGVEPPVALAPPTHLALVGAALPHLAASTRPSPQSPAGAGSHAPAAAPAGLHTSSVGSRPAPVGPKLEG